MPCRSPLEAQPYLNMAQQNAGVPPPTQPKNGPAVNGHAPHQLRNGYNERAMAEIKNGLDIYKKQQGGALARPVSALSTGSSTHSSDYVQCLALAGGLVLDEVRQIFITR